MLKHILVLLIVQMLSIGMWGSSWQVPVENFSPSTYGAGMQNWQIAQHAQSGWIYSANNYGMLEYDGNRWHLYGIWNSTSVRSVLPQGNKIYVGATNDFGVFTPRVHGEWEYQSLAALLLPDERDFGEIWSIVEHKGSIYFQGRHVLCRLNPNGELDYIPSAARLYCSVLQNDELYLASSEGILVLSGTALRPLPNMDLLKGVEVRSMVSLNKDSLLIGTDLRGLFILSHDCLTAWETAATEKLCSSQLYTLAAQDGKIAIGLVQDGLIVMKSDGSSYQTITREDGLQNNTVLSLCFDQEGDLWAGMDQGIDHIQFSTPIERLADGVHSYGAGYAAEVYNGSLYMGTNQGLYRLVGFDAEQPSQPIDSPIEMVSGSEGQVWSLAVVNGQLLCCHHRGLFRVEEDHIVPLCEEEGFWRIRALDTTRWIAGTYKGFYLIDDTGVRALKGSHETALNWEIDALGRIWLCSLHGLLRYEMNETGDSLMLTVINSESVAPNFVSVERIDDMVLVSSKGFGLTVNSTGEIDKNAAITLLDGQHMYGFATRDADGTLWYMRDDAIYVRKPGQDKHLLTITRLTLPGFESIRCIGGGYAIIGGQDGCYLLNSHKMSQREANRHIHIRQMVQLGQRDSLIYGEGSDIADTTIVLPAGEYSLRFGFAVDGGCSKEILYRSRLLPLEKEFSTWSKEAIREIRTLSYGQYTLEIEAMTDGVVMTRHLSFTIQTPWYRTRMAYILYGVLVVLALILTAIRIHRKFVKNQREFERVRAEEQRENKMRILELENQQKELELKRKSQELSGLLLNQISRNELADEVMSDLQRITDDVNASHKAEALKRLRHLNERLSKNRVNAIDWEEFEKNFDVVNANILQKLNRLYPWMTNAEKKLAVYIMMGLQTREIAPLLGQSTRGAEMMRYRMRQKMELESQVNLKEYFESLKDE